jgi:serine/threonine protein kinase/tetratricopeptide (TPR) repeat protein
MNKELSPNTNLSHYRIIAKLGAGGMGEVYLAEDMQLGRKVALKLLAEELTKNRDRLSRFDQEAYAASALNHPNIITIYEMGDEGGQHFIATEFIDGLTLRKYLKSAPIDFSEVLTIAIQVAAALEEAHAAGIIHRDIKPENIMIRPNGHVKVLDFGLAKLTQASLSEDETDTEAVTRALVLTDAGVVVGTSQYMSPEQARGRPVDSRTDVWSLGVVLYEMVAGRQPFAGETKTDVIAAIARQDPPPIVRFAPNVPAEFEWIVMKALRKGVDERYQTIRAMESDLKKLKQRLDFQTELERSMGPERLTGSPSVSGPADTETPGAPPILNKWIPGEAKPSGSARSTAQTRASSAEYFVGEIKRHKLGVAVIALAVVLIAAAIAFVSYSRKGATLTDKDTILLVDMNTTGDPVFDGTLKQALAVQLGQSPFLSIFSEDRVREALKFMGRSSDERLTKDMGLEICRRQGLKAMLVGSIASLGNHYVITLEAINAQTGDAIAGEQTEAENKEQVLHALGDAAMKLREKLGESLQSVEKFDAPIEQGTTSSLEAFKAFSLGVEQQLKGKYLEAIPFLKRATEIDPDFALAYARMASMYYNSRQYDLAAAASQKAFELRDRVSERERLYIAAGYFDNVTGELGKYLETLELWKRTYPRDPVPHNNLAVKYNELGLFDKTVEEAREAIRLNPSSASGYSLLAAAFVGLNRFDEAKKIIGEAQAQRLETIAMRRILYRIAFVQDDAATMRQQIEGLSGKPDEYVAQGWQSETAAFSGQLRKAREFSSYAIELAERRGLNDVAAQIGVGGATRDALLSYCSQAKEQTAKALGISRSQLTMANVGNALATCGEFSQTQNIIAELTRRFPNDTVLNKILLPLIQARIELQRGNPAQAIQLLETTRLYESYALFQIAYLRGQSYLDQKKGADAAAEFQKILDHRGWQPTSPIYSLAHLGLARAAALTGDAARARQAYQHFFALWKDADPDLPILIEAKNEYAKSVSS